MVDESSTGEISPVADPEYNSEYFINLVRKGKDEWNRWRRDPANQSVPVIFANIRFPVRGLPNDFRNFEFGKRADFKHADFGDGADFTGAIFDDRADFEGSVFGDGTVFVGTKFGEWAKFVSTRFGQEAEFRSAEFGRGADFTGAVFGDRAKFGSVVFGRDASLIRVVFGDQADFSRAGFDEATRFTNTSFGYEASFVHAIFRANSSFDGTAFGDNAHFDNTTFEGEISFSGKSDEEWVRLVNTKLNAGNERSEYLQKQHKESWNDNGAGPDRFSNISFVNAHFFDSASFSNRSFDRIADFTTARFHKPPNFESIKNPSQIDFTGAKIRFVPPCKWLHWTTDSQIPLRLRALRKIADETKNHDLERDLYIEERKAERGVYWWQLSGRDELDKKLMEIDTQKNHVWLKWILKQKARIARWLRFIAHPVLFGRLIGHVLWMGVMTLYWALADYGRSFVLPFVWLVASVFFFDCRYAKVLAPLMERAPNVERYNQALSMLALGNAVPFVGPLTIDAKIKEFLFCPTNDNTCLPPIPPEGFQLLMIVQNLLSIACVFFIGLALRNYFKIK